MNKEIYKEIYMVMSKKVARSYGYQGNSLLVRIEFDVDLDKLSPPARAIAENIYTTDNHDDLSNIRCYGPTQRELLIKEGRQDEIPKIIKHFGEDILDGPSNFMWWFDGLRINETPEDYFERQAKDMRDKGVHRISNYKEEECYSFI